MPKSLSYNEFDEKLKNFNKNIKRIGEYKNYRTKVQFQCLIDGYIWETRPFNIFVQKSGCPKCGKSLSLNNETFDEKIKDRNIRRLGNYINSSTKIEFECLVDGYKWYARVSQSFTN